MLLWLKQLQPLHLLQHLQPLQQLPQLGSCRHRLQPLQQFAAAHCSAAV
jgi:hypothetical protein